MKLVDAVKMIGREADLKTADFASVRVRILDVKMAYGNFRFVVEPINGRGETTVDAARVSNVQP